jgi:hypothetical protein
VILEIVVRLLYLNLSVLLLLPAQAATWWILLAIVFEYRDCSNVAGGVSTPSKIVDPQWTTEPFPKVTGPKTS